MKHYLITYMAIVNEHNTMYGHVTINMKNKLTPKNLPELIDYVQKNCTNNNTAVILNIYKF